MPSRGVDRSLRACLCDHVQSDDQLDHHGARGACLRRVAARLAVHHRADGARRPRADVPGDLLAHVNQDGAPVQGMIILGIVQTDAPDDNLADAQRAVLGPREPRRGDQRAALHRGAFGALRDEEGGRAAGQKYRLNHHRHARHALQRVRDLYLGQGRGAWRHAGHGHQFRCSRLPRFATGLNRVAAAE